MPMNFEPIQKLSAQKQLEDVARKNNEELRKMGELYLAEREKARRETQEELARKARKTEEELSRKAREMEEVLARMTRELGESRLAERERDREHSREVEDAAQTREMEDALARKARGMEEELARRTREMEERYQQRLTSELQLAEDALKAKDTECQERLARIQADYEARLSAQESRAQVAITETQSLAILRHEVEVDGLKQFAEIRHMDLMAQQTAQHQVTVEAMASEIASRLEQQNTAGVLERARELHVHVVFMTAKGLQRYGASVLSNDERRAKVLVAELLSGIKAVEEGLRLTMDILAGSDFTKMPCRDPEWLWGAWRKAGSMIVTPSGMVSTLGRKRPGLFTHDMSDRMDTRPKAKMKQRKEAKQTGPASDGIYTFGTAQIERGSSGDSANMELE
ncbi:hypothetical protein LTR50_007425 [Elasticomyces elasticus]|nr:hypothetical protein LTR50_007425 [Elasticomyces elasticus]